MEKDVPLFEIFWDEKDVEAVAQVICSGKYWSSGSQIEKFEEKICAYLDAQYCVTFNSGGTALYALMLAYDIGSGDEIIVPSFTFIATPYAPMYVGAKPVFADVEYDTFGLDPRDVETRITSKTKAIMPIHYGGMPCQIKKLKEIAEENDILLLEDAAESFGAKYDDKYVGTFGDAAVFSFCHNKVFTTGEGGCVVTDSKELYEQLKLVRSYGREVKGDYFTNPENLDYTRVGYNFRMSTLSAALGLSQLDKIEHAIRLRRKHAEYLNQELKELENVEVPKPPSNEYFPVYQMYTIRILDEEYVRNNLMEYFQENGITTRIYFEPVHKYSVFNNEIDSRKMDVPKTEKLSSQVVTLPLYPDMAKNDLDYISNSLKDFLMKRS